MSRERGRGRAGGDRSEDLNLHEKLKMERENISELKQHAYKSALWALRMDHQKINWKLELALSEIKKALNITQEVHNKIVQELDNEFSEAADEANRIVEANRKVVEDTGGVPTTENTSPEKNETNEDEGEDPRVYNGNIVGKSASIKWGGDGKFKDVVVIDYDMENGKHFLYHVSEKLYEWLDLNEMLSEDIRWPQSRGSGRGVRGRGTGRGGRGSGRGGRGFNQGIGESSQATSQRDGHNDGVIELYDIEQLSKMVMKVLETPTPDLLKEAEKHLEKQKRYLNLSLQAVSRKRETFEAEGPAQNPSVPHGDGGQGGDIHVGGEYENKSSDGRNTNIEDDKRGSIDSGRSSSTASGSKRIGSGSSSGRSGSSSDGSRSSGDSGRSGDGIGNNSDAGSGDDSDD